nr:hypothetical protein [Metallosphaera javensis (ex Hofmann et al. 2022)]
MRPSAPPEVPVTIQTDEEETFDSNARDREYRRMLERRTGLLEYLTRKALPTKVVTVNTALNAPTPKLEKPSEYLARIGRVVEITLLEALINRVDITMVRARRTILLSMELHRF